MNQSGLSLTEIVVSLFLVSLMLLSVSKLYLLGKNEYKKTQKLLNEHFELLWVSDLLSNSIRHAGFTPCLGIDQLKVMDEKGLKKSIPKIDIEHSPQPIMHIFRMSEHVVSLEEIKSPTELIVSSRKYLKEKHRILIADCEHAEIHNIARIDKFLDSWLVVLTQPLFYTFNTFTYIGEWMEEDWFVKSNKNKKNSLYYKLNDTEEISPLITSLTLNLKHTPQSLLVEVMMGLNEDHTKKILVGVRGLDAP